MPNKTVLILGCSSDIGIHTANKFLNSEDYLIVEDSESKQKQIDEFTKKQSERFKVDQYYLDFFGTNMTCSVDSIFKVF